MDLRGSVGLRRRCPDPLRILALPAGGTTAPRFGGRFAAPRVALGSDAPTLRSRPPRWGFRPGAASGERVQVVHAASTFVAAQGPQAGGVVGVTSSPSGRLQEPVRGTGVGEGPDRQCPEHGRTEGGPPSPDTQRARNGTSCVPGPSPRGKRVSDPLRLHLPALPRPGQAGTPGT